MKISAKKWLLFLLLTANYSNAYSISASNDGTLTADNINISNIRYDYTMSYDEDSNRPDCNGNVSFDVSFPPGASRILVARTRSHFLIYDNPFYSLRFSIDVNENAESEHVVFPNTSWGTFIRVEVFYEDSNNHLSQPFNTTEYLSAVDRAEIMAYHNNNSYITDEGHNAIVSDIKYDYTISYDSNGKPTCKGVFSYKAIYPESTVFIDSQRTRPNEHYTIDDADITHYYIRNITPVSEESYELTAEFDDVEWGNLIKIRFLFKDESSITLPIMLSTDYMTDEDKAKIIAYLDSPQINDDKQCFIISDGNIIMNSPNGGHLWMYDMKGTCVLANSFSGNDRISLKEYKSSVYILTVKFDDNRVLTRKIQL